MTKAQVRSLFPALFATWRSLPENSSTDEQQLRFYEFFHWLKNHHPEATRFRSMRGPSEDLEQWFDSATHQSWRN